jgi:hypothetical protein
MTDILHRSLAPSADIAESPVGDETIILHLKSGTYFGLDPTGTRIWTLMKQGLGPLEICERLATDYSIGRETIETDVREFLDNLQANDILIDL